MTSGRQSAMVLALSLLLVFLQANGLSMQEKVSSRSGQEAKVQTADWAGNEENEDDDDDDDDDEDNDGGPRAVDVVESKKSAAHRAAIAAAEAAATDAQDTAEAALVQTARPQLSQAAEKATAEEVAEKADAESAVEMTAKKNAKPKKIFFLHHRHRKHREVDQQIIVSSQASPAPAQAQAPINQQIVARPPGLASARALTPSQWEKERELAKKEDELEGKINSHAVEQARLRKKVMTLEQKLHANVREQSELKRRIEYLSNEARSDQDIDSSVQLVANETDSFAMANMMGRMWKEMRMFDVPMYAEHVAEKLPRLEKDQHKLEAELAKAERKLMPAEAPGEKNARGEEALDPMADNLEDTLGPNAGTGVTEHGEAKTPISPSKFNFWGMSAADKEETLVYSLVYFVAGVTLAFLFNKVRSSKPKLLTIAEKSGALPNPSDFSFSIFGCFDALNTDGMPWPCLLGCFCPCLRWAQTVDGQGLLPYWKAFFAFFILTALHCYSYGVSSILVVVLGVVYRQKIRQRHHIESGTQGTVAMDILVWLCCQPCAIIQEAREESVLRSGANEGA